MAWNSTDYSKGAKGIKVVLQTKNTHKNHWTYTTRCPFYAAEHGSLESLHPPEHPVTAVMFKGMVKETPSTFFNNSKFTKWQRRYRICTERMTINHSSILHFPNERLNNLRLVPECGGRMSLCCAKKRGCTPLTYTLSHTPHLLVFHLRWHACLWFCKGHKKISDSGIWTHKQHSNVRLVSNTNFWWLLSSVRYVLFIRTYLLISFRFTQQCLW